MKAFTPHGHWLGAAIGANADTLHEAPGMAQRQRQRAVAAHRMPEQAQASRRHGEMRGEQLGQLAA